MIDWSVYYVQLEQNADRRTEAARRRLAEAAMDNSSSRRSEWARWFGGRLVALGEGVQGISELHAPTTSQG